jgi:hypothetical protein
MGDQPLARLLYAYSKAQTQNKHKQISMPRVRFEPMIPVFERAKTVHAVDSAATVMGSGLLPRSFIYFCVYVTG